jgi:SET domain-containing protein
MGGKGFGLMAAEKIKKGSFIIQYIGEVVNLNSDEGSERLDMYSKSTCTYMMKLGSNEVIDPTYKGNMARFINHSCDPNCETQKWNVLGEISVGIFATRDIEMG